MVRPQLLRLEDRSTPAAIGSLDPTFDLDGRTSVAFDLFGASANDFGAAIAVQGDGKIVVVGTAQNGPTDTDFAIARLNPDGSLDTTFGSNGIRAVGFDLGGTNVDKATSVAIQADGAILVGGFAEVAANDFDYAVIRLDKNGDLDATFDKDGRQTIAFDVSGSILEDKASGIAVDSQGRIVLVGSVAQATAGDFDFGIARLKTDGSLDTTFDADGRQEVSFDAGGANSDTAVGVVIDSQDRILIAGSVQVSNFGDVDFGLTRLKVNGSLDTTFDTDGRATVEFDLGGTNADTAAAIALDGSGRIILAGTVAVDTSSDLDLGVVRFNADGSLDTSFDTDGKISVGFDIGGSKQDRATGVTINGITGDILVSATVDGEAVGDTDIGVLRLTGDGILDTSFSSDGRAVVAFDLGGINADTAGGIAQDAGGRILLAAAVDTDVNSAKDFGIARLIGTTGLSQQLVVGGPTNGLAQDFLATATGFVNQGTLTGGVTDANVRPAVADLNGDGLSDAILAAGPGGGSRVRIILGGNSVPLEFDAFEASFDGGLFVAAGDVDGDGRAEFVISPDTGGGPRTTVYSLNDDGTLSTRADFFGIEDPNFRGGARVAMGDINNDGRADVVVGAGFLGGPRVAIYNGATLFTPGPNGRVQKLTDDFFAFPGTDAVTLRNGVFVTVGDLSGDGFSEVIFGGGPGGGPRVFALDGKLITQQVIAAAYESPVANFFVANETQTRGGVRLAVKDIDGDDRADLIAASGDELPSRVRIYRGSTISQGNGVEPPALPELDPFGLELANGVFVG